MSWFDATGFANLAKSALKEAQKTIDKALDIKDEEQKVIQTHSEDAPDFFAIWGVKNNEEANEPDRTLNKKQQSSNSIWGSFTGSFFEATKFTDKNASINAQHSKSLQITPVDDVKKYQLASSKSLPDDLLDREPSNLTEVSNVQISDNASEVCDSKTSKESNHETIQELDKCNEEPLLISVQSNVTKSDEVQKEDTRESECSVVQTDAQKLDIFVSDMDENKQCSMEDERENEKKEINEQEINSSHTLNRISVISSESDKTSLESVEVLGSRSNTDCTTTPESEANSISNSVSPSSIGAIANSESVEILPDSLVTSPSSVEILGDWKSDSSPYLSPLNSKYLKTSPILDKDDSITLYDENINEDRSKHDQDSLSSDISPYQSPIDDVQTFNSNFSLDNIVTTSVPRETVCLPSQTNYNLPNKDHLKISPEDIETIAYATDQHEGSVTEDSYTSTSETTVITVMETLHQLEQAKPIAEFFNTNVKMHESCPDTGQILSKTSTDLQLNLSLDSLKDKHNLYLPLEAITTQPIRKPEYLETVNKTTEINPFGHLVNTMIEPPDSVNYIEGAQTEQTETLECTDQILILTDSSCEGTLIESSSEDNATLICTIEPKVTKAELTDSSYVKTMLADAMVEKNEMVDIEGQCVNVPRENSPISSESRSDLVKIGSDQTSGHTSGDELETTTSSDIEIISSPNGDSSSTQSRQSPAKLHLTKGSDLLTKTLKTRGHSRELSEISIGSDEANLEIEKLLKRIQEMTEILEARESKLIDVNRMNMELHEQNNNLKKQVDNFEKRVEQSQNLNQIKDEYTQRLSILEKKFQQAIRERDTLRKHLEQLKQEAATCLSSQEMSTINAEKDEIIKELRDEGEKLSKQQLIHTNIIKKLRVKEKENATTIKNQKEQIDEQGLELERLKRSLNAKEEVERTQIEAVHTLTAKTKKQEKEILTLQEKLDNAMHKIDAYKKSLDAAKVDLTETKQNLVEREEELKQAVENVSKSCQLLAQVEELKIKLRQMEEAHVKKEEFLKHENNTLLKRLENAEVRNEDLSESVSMATKPLLRQLEQVQANLQHKSISFMKQEKALSDKNIELQNKLESLVEMDHYLKEENVNLKFKISNLDSKVKCKETERTKLEELCKKLTEQNKSLMEENLHHKKIVETLQQTHLNQIKDFKREIEALENKLAVEKAATDAEKRKNHAILEQQQSIDDEMRLSPTLSIGRESASSVNSIWPAFSDSVFDNSERFPMVYESVRGGSGSATLLDNLQAQLKQRDGEIRRLQSDLSYLKNERDALNLELSTLTFKVEDLNDKIINVQALNENLNEIQTRYDALLQMYGEKVEENQELRLDLEDIKEMYKSQIDHLLKRDT